MRGCITIPFSSLFADTVKCHGAEFAYNHYVRKHKMAFWEFKFWRMAMLRSRSN